LNAHQNFKVEPEESRKGCIFSNRLPSSGQFMGFSYSIFIISFSYSRLKDGAKKCNEYNARNITREMIYKFELRVTAKKTEKGGNLN
jgi:hypothetical protein